MQPPLPLTMSDEQKILAYVQEHSSITNAECRELLGIESRYRVTRLLGKLAKAGQVRQVGTGKGTRYELPI